VPPRRSPPEPLSPEEPPAAAASQASDRAAIASRTYAHAISFEEKFGTLDGLISGVALALGGIFLVKYSIEARLIGRMRLFFGAALPR
jgi:uncharacterized membrane protein